VKDSLTNNNVEVIENFIISSVNVKNKELTSNGEKSIRYDLSLIMPSQSPSEAVTTSDLPTSENIELPTLTLKGHDNVFMIGGSLNLHGSQTYLSSLEQADFVSAYIANKVSGYPEPDEFQFKVSLLPLLSHKLATAVLIAEGKEIEIGRSTTTDYLLRLYAHSGYFGKDLRGFV
ncbi:MAG: hypothetical protein ACYDDC_07960, partial [Thermoplasmataceae archaeon]